MKFRSSLQKVQNTSWISSQADHKMEPVSPYSRSGFIANFNETGNTIRKVLNEDGIKHRKPSIKPDITNKHKVA